MTPEYQRAYYAAHREHLLERKRLERLKDPEYYREINRKGYYKSVRSGKGWAINQSQRRKDKKENDRQASINS